MDAEELDFLETTQLVSAAQEGNGDATEALFARYLPRVRAMVALRLGRKLGEMADIDDLVQDALLEAFVRLEAFEHRSEGSFRHWLACLSLRRVQTSARRARTLKRGEGRGRADRQVYLEALFVGREAEPWSQASCAEPAARVEAALLALNARRRRVFELRRLAGLSFAEIAQLLELGSESSARALFSRAMAELDSKLSPFLAG